MKFKEDILKKINSDFGEKSVEAIKILSIAIKRTDYLKNHRVIRCIVFLSEGNIDELNKFIKVAIRDPSDVMFWAEYENINDISNSKKVRDFDNVFEGYMPENEKAIITTERLYLRKITHDDFNDLCEIFHDSDVTSSWEHTFTEEQVKEWIEKQLNRYKKDGIGIYSAIEKSTGELLGQIGPLWNEINNQRVLEISWILKKAYWHKGYAVEGGKACVEYAFNNLNIDKIFLPIRPENEASAKVAQKLGATLQGQHYIKYNEKEMLHLIYIINKTNEK